MKKIISLILLISMIFSMSVVSYSEDLANDGDLKLLSSYVTSKYIFLDFNEAVLFDEVAQNNTILTIKDDTTPILFTASTNNEGKTLVLEVTGGMDITKAYTLNIPFIYNTDKKKFLFGTEVDISFTVYWNDNFESYETTADLDNGYRRKKTDAAIGKLTNLATCVLDIDEATGNKRMKIASTENCGVWINKSGWTDWNQSHKYYTLEADFERITDVAGIWMMYGASYLVSTCIWDINFYTDGVNFNNGCYATIFNDQKTNPIPENRGITSDGKDTIAVSTYKNAVNDSLDIFWDGNKITHREGTLTAIGGGVWGMLKSYGNSSFYVDNWKIYVPSVVFSSESSYIADIPTELYISGVLEEDEIVSVDIADDASPKVTTAYEWYKGTDKDAPLTDTEKWTKLDNTAKSYTVTAQDLTSYIVCRVKKTLKLNESENIELFDITTAPLLAPFAPECKNLTLTYTKGDTTAEIKAEYEYYDSNLDVQNGTVITWEESVDNSTWTPLSEITGITGDTNTDILDVTDVINKYVRCTVKVKNDGRKGDEAIPATEIYTLPFEPTAKAVSISGTASVGSLLQADYDYFDANGDKEKGSKFIWYKKYGATETIIAEDTLAYVVQSSDCGYSIGFKVIPKNEVYPASTTEYPSNEIAIPETTYTPSYSGSSVGGGSYTASVKPATKDDESKDNEKVLEALKESTKPAFADTENHWAEKQISELYKKGIVKGRENGFEPDAMITRAEWLTLLLRGIEEEASSKYEGIFDDVKEGEWYTQAVEKAHSLGLVSGDGESFNPNGIITREQMAKMAVLVYEYKNGEIKDSKDIDFSDKDDMSAWAEEYIKKAVSSGLMNGVTESEFSFSSSATRAQACVLLSRIIESLK